MTCPEHLPFYVFSTRECVEYFGMELFENSCTINNQFGVNIFMEYPCRLHNPFCDAYHHLQMDEYKHHLHD